MDFSLVEGPDGRPWAHRIDCPEVQAAREADRMVMTLFECQGDPWDLACACHVCLQEGASSD